MAAKINATVAALQLPEGFTVRKIKGVLKVVPARQRKAAIAVEEKAMLKAVRTIFAKEFDWQESMKDTVLANRETVFTADEMHEALESVCQEGEDLGSKRDVIERLDFLSRYTLQIRLEKIGEQTYKFRCVG